MRATAVVLLLGGIALFRGVPANGQLDEADIESGTSQRLKALDEEVVRAAEAEDPEGRASEDDADLEDDRPVERQPDEEAGNGEGHQAVEDEASPGDHAHLPDASSEESRSVPPAGSPGRGVPDRAPHDDEEE